MCEIASRWSISDAARRLNLRCCVPHFALVIGFTHRYEKNAGVATIVATMLPYTAATSLAWVLLFFTWYLHGLPFGLGLGRACGPGLVAHAR